jgi:alpha-L-rhamnosidase
MNLKSTLLILLLSVFALPSIAQKLTVSDITVNYKTNPIGIDGKEIRFSWKLISSTKQTLQKSYEIKVAESEEELLKDKNLVWNSGKVESEQSLNILYAGKAIKSRQPYYYRVKVTDNHKNSSVWSAVQSFETGILNVNEWQAKWIENSVFSDGKAGPAPIFSKEFNNSKKVKSARLYVTSHGVYETFINGNRVGDEVFTPGWTSYNKRLQYQTYNVTNLLSNGNNVLLTTIGDGWFRGNLGWNRQRNLYSKEVALLYQLEIFYQDGTKEIVGSDKTWRVSTAGPVKYSDIYNGEIYDANLAKSSTDLKSNKWGSVKEVTYDNSILIAPEAPAVRKKDIVKAIKIIKTPAGETVVDFGQNLVGWVKLKTNGKKGDTVTMHHAEVLDKAGNFYTTNLRSAQQENKYVLTGAKEDIFEPHFTFQGFRYIRLKGITKPLELADLEAVVIYSDMKKTGTFTTSNPLINKLQSNIEWGQIGNFLDVPTDCPQRDERLGWTGDAQVFFPTAAFNRDVAGFFYKWLGDLKADQHENGNVPHVVPDVRPKTSAGSSGWGDAATIIPWDFYVAYGDKNILSRQYESMKAWVGFIREKSKQNLWNWGNHYGDWLFYTMADDRDGKAAITDKFLIAQCFYAASIQNVINAAKVLENQSDVAEYEALLKLVKDAFVKEYVTLSGRLVSSSQTAYALALNFDMLPENMRAQAADRLAENIKSYKNHITTGFLGTPYLCHVLTKFGHNDLAYKLLLQDTYPSWLYEVKMGATTIWERWDGIKPDGTFQTPSMNSYNHYAYGAIGDWMYKNITGINPDATNPGYKKINISPKLGGDFTHAKASFESLYGTIESAWKKEGNNFVFDVVIPANTQADVTLPKSASTSVKEAGRDIKDLAYIKLMDSNGDIKVALGSGTYRFEYSVNK